MAVQFLTLAGNGDNMKWLGFGATNLSHATKLTGSTLAKKTHDTQLFYIMCYVQLGSVMKFEDLKIGQHLWGMYSGKLLMVAKFDDKGYDVCGAWECVIGKDECEIIELVDVPKGYEKTKLYYGR